MAKTPRRVALAQFLYESNTFSPVTGEASLFKQSGAWVAGLEAVRAWAAKSDSQLRGSLDVLEDAGCETLPVFAAVCGSPAGRLSRSCFREVVETLIEELKRVGPVDGLVLHLHGAACAEGEDDVEGALLEAIRVDYGFQGRIILSLDLHANVTHRMLRHVDGVTAYRTMPHRDFYATGERAAKLALHPGEIEPAMARLSALIPPTDAVDGEGPFAELQARAEQIREAEGWLDISLFPVQPWLDIEELGCAIVITGTGSGMEGNALYSLAEEWYAQRYRWKTHTTSWDDIIEKLNKHHPAGPWILVDTGDATSGGSPGNSTEALKRLWPYRDALPGRVLLWMVDANTVSEVRSGVTQWISGDPPWQWSGRLIGDGEGRFRPRGETYSGQNFSMGAYVVLEAGQLQVVVCEHPVMVPDPAFYECTGLEPDRALAVLAKSHRGWMAGFSCESGQGLLFDGPGVTSLHFDRLPYRGVALQCYPHNENPEPPITLWTSR